MLHPYFTLHVLLVIHCVSKLFLFLVTHLFLFYHTGIVGYTWCSGTRAGFCDVLPYEFTLEEQASNNPETTLSLADGHEYYVTVQANDI